jgi:hypothetical protein
MAKSYKVGDRVRFQGKPGTVTEIVTDLGQIRIKLDDGQGWRVAPEELKAEGDPEHKMVEGPRSTR